MRRFDHKKIEKKWQKEWQKSGVYTTPKKSKKKKSYILDMFPYPSGEGLHVGHPKGYIATDIYSRFKTMNGYSALHPMGWDAFGLPAENFAIQNKVHPREAVAKNITRFKDQLSILGFNYDWDREINTTDPDYYRWTQWIFLKFYEKGLAYESHEPINWCPTCQTGLANEDLEGGVCERCGSTVEKKPMRQWMLKITDYADRLLRDLDALDWPEHIKESQRNWIGKSEGAEIDFKIKESEEKVKVFTTRADTLYGATYLVLAPEHPFVLELEARILNLKDVKKYILETKKKTEIERTAEKKEKTGIKLEGVMAINPTTEEEIPIFIADYVLPEYGTGAIMAVPAHDERDYQFAKKYNLSIRPILHSYIELWDKENRKLNRRYFTPKPLNTKTNDEKILNALKAQAEIDIQQNGRAILELGILFNSGEFSGFYSDVAKEKITEKFGKKVTKYKLRDWVFSRQRYWGEPIPIIHCKKCGVVPVHEKDLPVLLPEVKSYEPTGTGESPLANISKWVNVSCPKCKGDAQRETNTMPQWAGSSWYYLRYVDPTNKKALIDTKKEKYWLPVDMYVGGAEHATRHLIYARYWYKFLFDIGIVNHAEPFTHFHSVGLILSEDGKKMSKRSGNVVNPDDIVERFGADAFRLYEMFMGPFGDAISWSTNDIIGTRKFLERVWDFSEANISEGFSKKESDIRVLGILHKTIQKVTDDIENFRFNTAVSEMMKYINALKEDNGSWMLIPKKDAEMFLCILAPFAPHITEELWHMLGHRESIHTTPWPKANQEYTKDKEVRIVVQINGKVRDTLILPVGLNEKAITKAAFLSEKVKKWTKKRKDE